MKRSFMLKSKDQVVLDSANPVLRTARRALPRVSDVLIGISADDSSKSPQGPDSRSTIQTGLRSIIETFVVP